MKTLKRFTNAPRLMKALAGIAILGTASFTGVLGASADAPQFNNASNDYPTLQVMKAGSTKWATSVSDLKQGDVINLLLWDHNTASSAVAQNVRLNIALNQALGTSLTATGTVSADNAVSKSSNVSIGTTFATKLTYISGSAIYYNSVKDANNNFSLAQAAFPNGINADSIVNGGIIIGSQAAGVENAHAVQIQVRIDGGVAALNTGLVVERDGGKAVFGSSAIAAPGDVVNFKVLIENRGSATAIDPRVAIDLDPRLTYVAGSSYTLTKGSDNNDYRTDVPESLIKHEGQKNTWGFDDMAPYVGSAQYLLFSAKVAPDASFPVGDTNITATSTVSFAGNNVSVVTNPVTVTVKKAVAGTVTFSLRTEVTTNKAIWYDERLGGAAAGDTVYYRLILQNTGNTVAQNVTLKDILPVGVSYVGNATLNGTSIDAASLINGGFTFASVNPGTSGTQTLIFETKVTDACTANAVLPSKGQVIYMNAVKAEDSADLIMSCTKGLIIQKDVKAGNGSFVDNAGVVSAGSTLTYRITVLNNGTETSTNTYLRDVLPKNATYVEGSLAIDDQKVAPEFAQSFFSSGILLTNLTHGLGKTVTLQVKLAACPTDLKSVINTAYVKSDTSAEISDTATASITCDVKPTPTPTSTPSGKPTPKPELPHTGGNEVALGLGILPAAGLSLRHALAKSRLKKAVKGINVL